MKFLEPRQESSHKLGIVSIKFFGFAKNQVFPEDENRVRTPHTCPSFLSFVILQGDENTAQLLLMTVMMMSVM